MRNYVLFSLSLHQRLRFGRVPGDVSSQMQGWEGIPGGPHNPKTPADESLSLAQSAQHELVYRASAPFTGSTYQLWMVKFSLHGTRFRKQVVQYVWINVTV